MARSIASRPTSARGRTLAGEIEERRALLHEVRAATGRPALEVRGEDEGSRSAGSTIVSRRPNEGVPSIRAAAADT